jgi:DnaK suppressor protein
MLKPAEIASFQERLTSMMKRLRGDLGQLREEAFQTTGGEASGSLSDLPFHLADLGSRQAEEDLTLDLVGNEEQMLIEIDAALTRIEEGKFGCCESCHQEIARERLEALPYSRYCVACAQKREKKIGP